MQKLPTTLASALVLGLLAAPQAHAETLLDANHLGGNTLADSKVSEIRDSKTSEIRDSKTAEFKKEGLSPDIFDLDKSSPKFAEVGGLALAEPDDPDGISPGAYDVVKPAGSEGDGIIAVVVIPRMEDFATKDEYYSYCMQNGLNCEGTHGLDAATPKLAEPDDPDGWNAGATPSGIVNIGDQKNNGLDSFIDNTLTQPQGVDIGDQKNDALNAYLTISEQPQGVDIGNQKNDAAFIQIDGVTSTNAGIDIGDQSNSAVDMFIK